MKHMPSIFAAGVLAIAGHAYAADAVTDIKSISLDAAQQVAAGALAHCRAEGQHVSVTVLDRVGRRIVALRDDGAAPHSFEHSRRKAYTALTYNMPSADYGKRAAGEKGVAIGPQLLPHITTAAGGVPIRANGVLIGAVGVSGTPGKAGGGEGDAKCGQAGIDRIAAGLGNK
jgi:uncharacterized protein GlcG (DUF336 family)